MRCAEGDVQVERPAFRGQLAEQPRAQLAVRRGLVTPREVDPPTTVGAELGAEVLVGARPDRGVPPIPAGRYVPAGLRGFRRPVAVEVLADVRGRVTSALQPDGEGVRIVQSLHGARI